jgi:IS605 OrfB family transposase
MSDMKTQERPVKAVQFKYTASDEFDSLFEDFRLMCNDAIRIALQYEKDNGIKVRNRFKLIELAYHRLKEYGLHTHYILSACEVAYAVYRNKNRKSDPYVKQPFIKLDNQSYILNHLILRIPTRPRQFIYLTLQASNYHLSFIDDSTLKRGSVTLTGRTVSITFSKELAKMEPRSKVAYDINEKSMVGSDDTRYDLSEVARLHTEYLERRSKFYEKHSEDRRLKTKFSSQSREKIRVKQFLHKISKAIIANAKEQREAIILERIMNINLSHRKGNGEKRTTRGRLHRWSFRELRRQIQYKAAWAGIPVEYINPKNTSRTCSVCGYLNKVLGAERAWRCPQCGTELDRDSNAAKNILSRSKLECQAVVQPEARDK